MIVIGQSSSTCPSLNSHTIIILKIRSVTHLITKVSNIMHTQINGWPSKVTLPKIQKKVNGRQEQLTETVKVKRSAYHYFTQTQGCQAKISSCQVNATS